MFRRRVKQTTCPRKGQLLTSMTLLALAAGLNRLGRLRSTTSPPSEPLLPASTSSTTLPTPWGTGCTPSSLSPGPISAAFRGTLSGALLLHSATSCHCQTPFPPLQPSPLPKCTESVPPSAFLQQLPPPGKVLVPPMGGLSQAAVLSRNIRNACAWLLPGAFSRLLDSLGPLSLSLPGRGVLTPVPVQVPQLAA